jgi:hypothetical protein
MQGDRNVNLPTNFVWNNSVFCCSVVAQTFKVMYDNIQALEVYN